MHRYTPIIPDKLKKVFLKDLEKKNRKSKLEKDEILIKMKRTNSANILRMLGVRSWIFETHLRRLDEVTGIECGTSETEAH